MDISCYVLSDFRSRMEKICKFTTYSTCFRHFYVHMPNGPSIFFSLECTLSTVNLNFSYFSTNRVDELDTRHNIGMLFFYFSTMIRGLNTEFLFIPILHEWTMKLHWNTNESPKKYCRCYWPMMLWCDWLNFRFNEVFLPIVVFWLWFGLVGNSWASPVAACCTFWFLSAPVSSLPRLTFHLFRGKKICKNIYKSSSRKILLVDRKKCGENVEKIKKNPRTGQNG